MKAQTLVERPGSLGADRLLWTDTVFIATLVVVSGLSAFVGIAAPLGSFASDTFFLLDNAYRVVQGQIPHRDFSSAWGPIMYLIDAAGLRLSGMRPTGLGHANAVFGVLLATWSFLLARSRWSPAAACAVGVYTILLITAPFPLGYAPLDFSYAMVYNRYGYAIFGIILIECAAVALPTRTWIRQRTAGAISTGIGLGLLAFLKITYAIVAIPFIGLLMIGVRSGRMRRLIAVAGGFAICSALILSYLRFDVPDILRDLAIAASARPMTLQLSSLTQVLIVAQNVPLLLLVGLLCASKAGAFQERPTRRQAVLLVLLTVAAGSLLLLTNQQPNAFPLNVYAAVVLAAGSAYRSYEAEKSVKWRPGLATVLLLALCFVPLSEEDVISLTGATLQRQWPTRPNVTSLAIPERGTHLFFAPWVGIPKTNGAEYVQSLNEGLELIRRHCGGRDGVLTFDMFNPFNYLLNRRSPRGGFAAAAYDYVYSDAAHPTAERFFGDTTYMLIGKYDEANADREAELNNVLGPMRIYGAALRARFTPVAQTQHWVLWRRK
ncbi:MAG: hypothetical protein JO092_09765 [Candidatus Eremiobacteraeota bacterium]|nr:hypothetical protein [Candidatus Eremiobacteraeota bacterium]